MATQPDPLTTALTGRYTIEHELGRGGSSTVYLAHDLRYDRTVALKVLKPELAAALGSDRFLREVNLTARLNHPHILPLLDSGHASGLLFYVMPYAEGESLRDRLDREEQLPLDDALQVAREVADALAYAHQHGVIHRDIKPGNILLSGGHAVVADFGIARAITVAAGEHLTESGMAIGTPRYMSPEQAAGSDNVDGRTDLYSLGCVLYEMLTGQPPFTGPSAQAVLARQMLDPVPPVTTVRKAVPPHVERALLRALEKVPADRFATVRQFADALAASGLSGVSSIPLEKVRGVSRRTLGWLGAVAGAAVLVLLIWRQLVTPAVAPAPEKKILTLAVLPGEQLGDTADLWLAAGISEEIADRLTNVSGLRVISPSEVTAKQLGEAGASIRQLGRDANVQYALRQLIRTDRTRSGLRQLRISFRLIRLEDGTNSWAASYTDTLVGGALFELQAEVAEHVTRALNVALLTGESTALNAQPTHNPEAFEAYLRGKAAVAASYGESGLGTVIHRAARQEYLQATTLDPAFAEAHARLSREYAALGQYAQARQAAERALALNPRLAWGHYALAVSYYHERQWERVRSELATAENLAPNSAEILTATATMYNFLGESEHARRNYERAFERDPLSWHRASDLGVSNFQFRRFPEAERYFDRAIALADTEPAPYVYKAWLYLSWHGSISQARTVLQTEVKRLGVQRGFGSFLQSYWWASRLLGVDPWYRGVLEAMSLADAGMDSAKYYSHKAGLYEGVGQAARARIYWDSATSVFEGRWQKSGEPLVLSMLSIAHAAQGDSEQALAEAGRYAVEEPQPLYQLVTLALVNTELGQREPAAEQFERLTQLADGWVTPQFLALDPALDSLRAVPRFQRLLQRK